MNWGTGLAVTMVAFMVLILSFVYRSTQQDFSLVTQNYYEESLDHDVVQLKQSNYRALDDNVIVAVNKENKVLEITLPQFFSDKSIDGNIYLYRPTDDKEDVQFLIKDASVSVPTKDLLSGLWKIKVDWTTDGKAYLFEQSIFLN